MDSVKIPRHPPASLPSHDLPSIDLLFRVRPYRWLIFFHYVDERLLFPRSPTLISDLKPDDLALLLINGIMDMPLKYLVSIVSLIILFTFSGCDTSQNIDREAVKKEMQSREIKRVLESDILLEGERIGKLISAGSDSIAAANIKKYQIVFDSIRWSSVPSDSTISSILDVYQYASEEGLDMPEGIQTTTKKELFYCIPLSENDSIQGVVIMTIPRKDLILHYDVD